MSPLPVVDHVTQFQRITMSSEETAVTDDPATRLVLDGPKCVASLVLFGSAAVDPSSNRILVLKDSR